MDTCKTILVAGGDGYIDIHTILQLAKAKHNVVIFYNTLNKLVAIERVKKLLGPDLSSKVQSFKGNLEKEEDVKELFSLYTFHVVVFFVGLTDVLECKDDADDYISKNILGGGNLMNAMNEVRCRKIVISCAAALNDDPENIPYTKEFTCNKQGPYKKIEAEILQMLEKFHNKNRFSIIKLVYYNPAGAVSTGELGDNPMAAPNNLVSYCEQVANGSYLDLRRPNLMNHCYYTHVLDVADGHCLAVEKLLKEEIGFQIYHLASKTRFHNSEQVRQEFIINARIPRAIPFKDPHFSPSTGYYGPLPNEELELNKTTNVLQWRPKYDLRDMCRDHTNWVTRNPFGYPEKEWD